MRQDIQVARSRRGMEDPIWGERAEHRVEIILPLRRRLEIKHPPFGFLSFTEIHHLISPALRGLGYLEILLRVQFLEIVLRICSVLDKVRLRRHLVLALLGHVAVFEHIGIWPVLINIIQQIFVILSPGIIISYQYF